VGEGKKLSKKKNRHGALLGRLLALARVADRETIPRRPKGRHPVSGVVVCVPVGGRVAADGCPQEIAHEKKITQDTTKRFTEPVSKRSGYRLRATKIQTLQRSQRPIAG